MTSKTKYYSKTQLFLNAQYIKNESCCWWKPFYLFSLSADQWNGKKKKTSHYPICPSPLSIPQNKTAIIYVWAVVVKNKCWWSSDVYNSIQVLWHIKTLYGHIIKERHYCLDWLASWFQVANGALMPPYESRPSLWQTGEWWKSFWDQSMTDCP